MQARSGRQAAALLVLLAMLAAGCGRGEPAEPRGDSAAADVPPPAYVGGATCRRCHALQGELWDGSHHDLALQEAREDTVLGDFDGAVHDHYGVRTTFERREDGAFVVNTDGPDGELRDFVVRHVFGVDPLQQLLIDLPGGRLQALSVAWDSRPAEDGGQRWFHLYPDEPIPAGDLLHWTGPNQNWNYMCATCHSTGLSRGYDAASDTYETTWEEEDVSCEACHGPGSRHVDWAEGRVPDGDPDHGDLGLAVRLKDESGGKWELDPETGNARRTAPRSSRAQVETCAPCHSRRSELRADPAPGRPFADSFRLSLLDEALYHADGQILDEVYVYGSFLQSRMHREGVTCSDCHDPHSGRPLFEGNALCARCHLPAKYDAPSHHHHPAGGPGSQCVDCHMPERTYMVVDPRRDHSLRVPRPDLSVELGTPNACTQCHAGESDAWAAERVAEWFPGGRSGSPHFAHALHAGRERQADAAPLLAALAADPEQPGIARATALTILPETGDPAALRAALSALADPDPLVRAAALGALEVLPPADRLAPAFPLLDDPLLAVRVEAARVLAPVPPGALDPARAARLEAAVAEALESFRTNAERPDAHLNLGVLYMDRGRLAEAEAAFRTAVRIEPRYVAGHVNLADLHRRQGREVEAERALEDALAADPNSAAAHHAMGLLYARTDRMTRAVEALARASGLAPDDARYAYVYGVALHSLGDVEGALATLAAASQRFPGDRSILEALATMSRDAGKLDAAVRYAEQLARLAPQDPGPQRLLAELRALR